MRKPKATYLYFAFILSTVLSVNSFSQNKVQVYTTTVEKTIQFAPGDFVEIKGEKSNMTIDTWDKREVKVILKIVSKNSDKILAEKELQYMKYFLDKTGHKIELTNYFLIPNNAPKVSSNIKAEYEIWIPKESPVSIKNYYGKISVKNIIERITVTNAYGSINLNNVKGKIIIKANFSDVTGDNIVGTVTADVDHSDLTLNKINGDFKIKADFGSIFLSELSKTTTIEIGAAKGDTEIGVNDFKDFNYNLMCEYGEIKLPEDGQLGNLSGNKTSFIKKFKSQNSKINIKTSFGKIVIKQ